MPNIFVFGKAAWLPPNGATSSRQHACMRELISKLPFIVAHTLQDLEQQKVKAEEVAVFPLPLHAWAQNCSDVEIWMEPGRVSGRNRQFAVAQNVKTDILELLDGPLFDQFGLPGNPSLTVACQPQTSSGMMVNALGAVALSWGLEASGPGQA